MLKDSKALEYSCYSIGAGAFGIFARWMQLQLGRNEEGLFDPSFWNVFIVALIIGASIFYISFIRKFLQARMYVPADFYKAYKNDDKIFKVIRILITLIMFGGSALLFMQCDADMNAIFLQVLAILGIISGISFPLILSAANRPHNDSMKLVTFLHFMQIAFFAFWLVTCYKQNSISSIGWSFVVELVTVSVVMMAFFRVAGFAYGVPNWERTMFLCLLGTSLCLMSLSDERYIGQQVLLVGSAGMLLTYNWLMISNMRQGKKENVVKVDTMDLDYINTRLK